MINARHKSTPRNIVDTEFFPLHKTITQNYWSHTITKSSPENRMLNLLGCCGVGRLSTK